MKTKTIAKSTKTVAKKPNAKATKITTTKPTKKNATVAKPTVRSFSQYGKVAELTKTRICSDSAWLLKAYKANADHAIDFDVLN